MFFGGVRSGTEMAELGRYALPSGIRLMPRRGSTSYTTQEN